MLCYTPTVLLYFCLRLQFTVVDVVVRTASWLPGNGLIRADRSIFSAVALQSSQVRLNVCQIRLGPAKDEDGDNEHVFSGGGRRKKWNWFHFIPLSRCEGGPTRETVTFYSFFPHSRSDERRGKEKMMKSEKLFLLVFFASSFPPPPRGWIAWDWRLALINMYIYLDLHASIDLSYVVCMYLSVAVFLLVPPPPQAAKLQRRK